MRPVSQRNEKAEAKGDNKGEDHQAGADILHRSLRRMQLTIRPFKPSYFSSDKTRAAAISFTATLYLDNRSQLGVFHQQIINPPGKRQRVFDLGAFRDHRLFV